MENWSDYRFQRQVDSAVVHVRRVLDNNKNPLVAGSHQHTYDDKYDVSELVTNASIASHLTFLANIGTNEEKLATLVQWSRLKSITLRFKSEERCTFLKEVKRKYDSENKLVIEGSFGTWTAKVSHTATEYKWRFEINYEVVAFRGTGESPEDVLLLQQRSGSHDLFTKTDKSVRPAVSQKPHIDVDLSWIFHQLQGNSRYDGKYDAESFANPDFLLPQFAINRDDSQCFTPRRNKDIEEAIDFVSNLHSWCDAVHAYFLHQVFPIQEEYQRAHRATLDTPAINTEGLFVPILPIFIEETPGRDDGNVDHPILAEARIAEEKSGAAGHAGAQLIGMELAGDGQVSSKVTYLPDMALVNSLLREEQRVLHEKFAVMDTTFPPGTKADTLITAMEGRLIVSLLHTQQICQQHVDALDYIENLLRQQVVAAIGKEVKPSDFGTYMRFHNGKLFQAQYQPKPFCYAVRRSDDHAPEGVLSIEEKTVDGSMAEPIYSLVNCAELSNQARMHFTLNAATSVRFSGEMFLHAYMRHEFHQDSSLSASLSLRAEARQFSSYIVMIGRISSATSFDPKYAMIVQNKDDITIPLDLETIPSAKEFKDAISSLSPEQQRFAKAFRGMQLESTLFGVLVIQIKPQLEKVLNIPPDSLTKEIQLTQDLMEMFIKYQIPSDLLSYAGTEDVSLREKIERVKGHVGAIQTMITAAKEKEIQDKKQEALHRHFTAGIRCEEGNVELMLAENKKGNSRVGGLFSDKKKKSRKSESMSFSMQRGSRRLESAAAAPAMEMSMDMNDGGGKVMDESLEVVVDQAEGGEGECKGTESHKTMQPSDDAVTVTPLSETDLAIDCTKIPQLIDSQFEAIDKEGAVRPTIINPGKVWSKRSQKALLDEPITSTLDVEAQKKEKNAAFDLLDALSKSGGLTVEHAQMHVVIAATHCFDKNLMDTIVQSNVNPIEKVEMSTLIMAATIHHQPLSTLVRADQLARVLEFSPNLLQIARS